MFIQIIQGHVHEPSQVRAALDDWVRRLAAGSHGWLGTTAGVTDDNELIVVVRFESEEEAQRNSHRAEQHQWWMETSKLFAGDVMFHDSTLAEVMLDGGSDDAGFVQVIQGRAHDPARLQQLGRDGEAVLREYRPDIIGGTVAVHDGDRFTQTVYFTSEEAAREGERKLPPPEASAVLNEMAGLMTDLRYLDITEPWLYSPVHASA